ncbi:phospho-N-acetylmuramoyl-pentapeptide-transferase [Sulfurospirillum diekertiae]|uniref:Phospho-N-acetylmuramoyl-pentapeptide-transferase n=1 Tax=Sulfurospirillum diekertiae TaxID=1854492 RepID=A0A6G9VPJ4_9BACT|nr:phospho-N-acetylmuramoyl-pentapeptide-transferase [Sulfurospirillum diekertiae]QIR75436.1 phospho-N-acetylmuramoyl-pentapeptide-transferase [Sulfurospirillum diekertiae]QIR78085.1 phospho-N-acetylmuramoyl-pentapeptide-transferase [Sulfurospirillum diekertiae]
MLYALYKLTSINLFQYITVRAGIAFFLAFILTIYLMPKFIKWAKSRNANQPIYSLAPESHQKKSKTPTMGGIVFLCAATFSVLICARMNNLFVLLGLACILLFGLIGMKDDLAKILGKSNTAGLTPRGKLGLQILASSIIALLLYLIVDLDTTFFVPFYKFPLFDMHLLALAFWVLVMVSASNAVNLTDGLDGLATVPAILSILSLAVFVYVGGNAFLSSYLLLPKVGGSGEVVIVATAVMGSLVGFLWFNCYPAQIFMGDSGSLSIGAFIGYMAIISKNEILLLFIGFVFVLETASVILQVGSFKTRKKRIFLMAPIHHHFEVKGWPENKIIVRFWIIALMSNLLALTALKIR